MSTKHDSVTLSRREGVAYAHRLREHAGTLIDLHNRLGGEPRLVITEESVMGHIADRINALQALVQDKNATIRQLTEERDQARIEVLAVRNTITSQATQLAAAQQTIVQMNAELPDSDDVMAMEAAGRLLVDEGVIDGVSPGGTEDTAADDPEPAPPA